MVGLLAPTVLAIVVARILGGTPRAVLTRSIHGWPLIVGAFAVELVLYNPPVDGQAWAMGAGPWIWVATKLVLLGVVGANLRSSTPRWPWLVVFVGLALNTVVVVANGGYMPQSIEAANAVWGTRPIDPLRLHNVIPMTPGAPMAWLGDVIAEPTWLPRANVISLGDIVLALGVASLLFAWSEPTWRCSGISWSNPPLHGDAQPSRRCST
jgi:hypothetical protein